MSDYHRLPSEPPPAAATPSANVPPVTTAGAPGQPGMAGPAAPYVQPGIGVPGNAPVLGQPAPGYFPHVQPPSQAYVQPSANVTPSSFSRLQQNFSSALNDFTRVTQSTLNHFTMAPNPLNTTLGKIEHSAKIAMAGGPELFWRQSFSPAPTDKLVAPPYVCYLSTSMGLVPGFLYISHATASFSSDRPLAYSPTPGRVAHSYYKVVVPLEKVGSVLSSQNPVRPTDQYIQLVTVDRAEFWFTGFISFSTALEMLQMAVAQHQSLVSAAAAGIVPPGMTPQQGTATGTPVPLPTPSTSVAASANGAAAEASKK